MACSGRPISMFPIDQVVQAAAEARRYAARIVTKETVYQVET